MAAAGLFYYFKGANMALRQAITNEKGAATIYHRIAKAELDFTKKTAEITIFSYATEALRQCEKDDLSSKEKYKELSKELDELIANPTDENEARRVELSEQINELNPFNEITERHLTESTHELPIDDNFSMKDAYLWLKNNTYTDSVDV